MLARKRSTELTRKLTRNTRSTRILVLSYRISCGTYSIRILDGTVQHLQLYQFGVLQPIQYTTVCQYTDRLGLFMYYWYLYHCSPDQYRTL